MTQPILLLQGIWHCISELVVYWFKKCFFYNLQQHFAHISVVYNVFILLRKLLLIFNWVIPVMLRLSLKLSILCSLLYDQASYKKNITINIFNWFCLIQFHYCLWNKCNLGDKMHFKLLIVSRKKILLLTIKSKVIYLQCFCTRSKTHQGPSHYVLVHVQNI